MLQFLAHRAVRKVGPAVSGDPWHGVGAVALSAIEEGPLRSPSAWLGRWTGRVVEDFWRGQSHDLLQADPGEMEMGALVKAQNAGRKRPTPWGQWPGSAPSVLMGVTVGDTSPPDPLPADVRVVGVEFSPTLPEAPFRQVLEEVRKAGRQAWWIVPATGGSWRFLNREHYLLAHRLGLSLWLEAPTQAGWSDYLESLRQATSQVCRDAQWEQWVWPVCDLLQKGFEESLNPLAPRASAPWKWEGRIRRPDWRQAQQVVWDCAEEVLGGSGTLGEILVACALADKGVIRQEPGIRASDATE